ncbi:CheY-like chemotaxis protein [Ancylobacter sp. 3268]|uniref:response regulator n=1 Tax=Ancylobacter sp. 3268 TaxID=2817752 RepID=UPI002863855F|nr:response regulator [Ancylobacter sp. 3268]MDR6952760.1 CheY-like chemotaxis protein [Ancylobacter sp. 3268]
MESNSGLAGRGIFVVEDEPLVALMVEAMIEELGAVVIGSARRPSDALDFVAARHGEIDVALLDLNLGGIESYDVAQAAADQGIPVVFSTGYDDDAINEPWRGRPLLSKPFQLAQLEAALAQAVASRGGRG